MIIVSACVLVVVLVVFVFDLSRSTGLPGVNFAEWSTAMLAATVFPPTSWFCQLYGFLASVDFSSGTSRVSPVAQRILVIVLPLQPRQSVPPRRPVCDVPCCLRLMKEGSASGVDRFEASFAFTFVAARQLAHHPEDGFVDRLSGLGFAPPYYPSYRALASTLVSLSSLNAPAFAGHTFTPVYPGAP